MTYYSELQIQKQEIFDAVYTGLKSQNFQQSVIKGRSQFEPNAHGVNSACAYRGVNGLKCAAGHLIPDEYYNPNEEGHSVGGVAYLMECYSNFMTFLEDLQGAHDTATSHKDMELRLKKVAVTHELDR